MARWSWSIRQRRGVILILSQLLLATAIVGAEGARPETRLSASQVVQATACQPIKARVATGRAGTVLRNRDVAGDTVLRLRAPLTPPGQVRSAAPQAAGVQSAGRFQAAVAAQTESVDLAFAADRALNPSAAGIDVSSVGSPSVAVNGNTVVCTGNWYAAVSTNGGATFQYLDPVSFFSNPGEVSCYNQSVIYVPGQDLFVWTLEYARASSGENLVRLAYASTRNVASGVWSYFDFPASVLEVNGSYLNMPKVVAGSNSLYLSMDVFDAADNWRQACVLRIPFSDLRNGTLNGTQVLKLSEYPHLALAQGIGSRLYFAAHENTSTLRVYYWDEGSTTVYSQSVTTASYQNHSYVSTTPDGYQWLGRADDRLQGAVQVGNELWFAWMAGQGGPNNLPQPYVQIARIRTSDFQVVENRALWNGEYAYAYPALAANASGEVGISLAYGGPTQYPSHAIGFLTGSSVLMNVSQGAYGPDSNAWGDYLTIRTYQPNTDLFAAVGYSLQSGSERVGTAEPRYVVFGRTGDVGKIKGASVRVVSPNGGENWPLLSSRSIQWISTGLTGNVKIEISRDGGATWEVEGYALASTGRFPYAVSGAPTSRARVRISDTGKSGASDVSDANFTISGLGREVVTVSSPSRGETWASGTWQTIEWDSTALAGDVRIELTRDGGYTYELLGTAAVTGNWFLWSVCGPSTTQARVRISLLNDPTVYALSEPFTITVNEPGDGRPAAPSNLVAVLQGSDQARLSWSVNSSTETGFRVEVKTGRGGFVEIPNLNLGKGANQVTIGGLSSKTSYYFRVCAYNAAGQSSYSNEALAVPGGVVPAAPKKLKARVLSQTEVLLSWLDMSGNESAFEVQVSTDRRTYRVLGVTGAGANATHVYGLWPNTKYYFRVRAVNSVGYSGYSNVANTKTKR